MPRIYKATKSEAVVFNGISFRRYPTSNQWQHRMYFTPHASHRRAGIGALHQEIWKAAHGPIPDGHEIHHADGNPLNNDPANLECLTKAEHDERHHDERSERAVISEAARQAAAEWHGSPAGIEWHRQHGKQTWKDRKPTSVTCTQCGKSFDAMFPTRAKYCSTKCQQRYYACFARLDR